jgi:hypothetical protein
MRKYQDDWFEMLSLIIKIYHRITFLSYPLETHIERILFIEHIRINKCLDLLNEMVIDIQSNVKMTWKTTEKK